MRDRCGCDQCRHAGGQRLLDPATIPLDLRLGEVTLDGDSVHIVWLPEGHHSVYSIDELDASQVTTAPQLLWDAGAAGRLPVADHSAISANRPEARRHLLRWLTAVDAMGCGLLHGVPTVDGEVARVAELFGHVRETNYGRWFDVRSVVDPTNLANSSLGLAAHTDNPYR